MNCGSGSGPRWSSDRRRSRLTPVVASLLLFGCGSITVSQDREQAFSQAVEAFQKGNHQEAAAASWGYLKGATTEDPRYDRALRLLAESVEKIGLTYAASTYFLTIAKGGRDQELVPQAVRGIERIVAAHPHDHEILIRAFIASADLSKMPDDIQPFVDYHKGLDAMQQGLHEWADKRLARIPELSRYYQRARYLLAVRKISRGKLQDAEKEFLAMLKDKKVPKAIKTDIHRSLARMYFDLAEYELALERYEELRTLAPNDPELLLEMAWTQYYLGDSRRALGLLLALDAPVYRDLIAPERFLLEAMCFRRLCQFDPARSAAVRLRKKHGDAIRDLYSGNPLLSSKAIRAAARRRQNARQIATFVDQINDEIELLSDIEGRLGADLAKELRGLYTRGRREALRRENEILAKVVREVAESLLTAEEGVRLTLHELSVGVLRGRRRPSGPPEARPVKISAGGENVFYSFEGDFWTDELDDLVVVLEDRCID